MYVRQAIDLLEGLIPGGDEGKDLQVPVLEKFIVFAFMWSLGALLELDDRKKVSSTVDCEKLEGMFFQDYLANMRPT